MMRALLPLSIILLLAGCSEDSSNTNDPINNDPQQSAPSAATTDADPTPQTGTGGQSAVESETGTEKR